MLTSNDFGFCNSHFRWEFFRLQPIYKRFNEGSSLTFCHESLVLALRPKCSLEKSVYPSLWLILNIKVEIVFSLFPLQNTNWVRLKVPSLSEEFSQFGVQEVRVMRVGLTTYDIEARLFLNMNRFKIESCKNKRWKNSPRLTKKFKSLGRFKFKNEVLRWCVIYFLSFPCPYRILLLRLLKNGFERFGAHFFRVKVISHRPEAYYLSVLEKKALF